MAAEIESFHDTPDTRVALATFLARSFRRVGGGNFENWRHRIRHWWDENPFASAHPCRGWVLSNKNEIVGYLGVIPSLYEHGPDGRTTPALAATSFAIDEGHRHAALAMGGLYHKLGETCVLIDTTPSPQVQAMLRRGRWSEQREVTRKFLLTPLARRQLPPAEEWLPPGHRITTEVGDVTRVAAGTCPRPIQKHVTPASLRWYCASRLRHHQFAGVVDAAGTLTSCVLMTPRSLRGLPAWAVVDWFTARDDSSELQFLVAAQRQPLLSVAEFPDDPCWRGLPCLHQRMEDVCHFYRLPPHLHHLPKRTVLAEGDLGL